MSCLPWSQGTQPEDLWYTELAQENSTEVQPLANDWTQASMVSSVPDFQPQSVPDFTFAPHGPVDSGLAPALSYSSRSLRSRNHFSEAESYHDSNLAYAVSSAMSWNANANGLAGHAAIHSSQQPLIGDDIPFTSTYPVGTLSTEVTYSHGVQGLNAPVMMMPTIVQPGQVLSQQPIPTGRPLLPRTKAVHASPSGQSNVSDAVHRPPIRRSLVSSQETLDVSSMNRTTSPQVSLSGPSPSQAILATADHLRRAPPSASIVRVRSSGPTQALADPTADDFSAFIHVPPEDQMFANDMANSEPAFPSAVPSSSEQWDGFQSPQSESDSRLDSGLPSQGVQATCQTSPKSRRSSNMTTSASVELDEGRHRNHPLYSRGPDPDGMYRCPWKAVENCPHEPNKLKCNYDKFIDSHLKPFRCKAAACAKQEFSSTACLLRHEREAHGMHGHGDRPHLCYYTPCERSVPGHGFPRLYNLRDHMKRVHDWKEPIDNEHGESGSKRGGGPRKRKAPAAAASGGPVQRQKAVPAVPSHGKPTSTQGREVLYAAAMDRNVTSGKGVTGAPTPTQEQRRRRAAYQQWIATTGPDSVQSNYVPEMDGTIDIAQFGPAPSETRRFYHGPGYRSEG